MTTRYISIPGETVRRSAAAAPGRTAPRRRRRVKKRRHPLRALLLLAVLAAVAWGGLRLLDGLRVEADWAARGIAVKDVYKRQVGLRRAADRFNGAGAGGFMRDGAHGARAAALGDHP